MKTALITLAILVVAGFGGYKLMEKSSIGETPSNPIATSTLSTTKSVTINGVTITPLEVTEDSRCPQGVQCIWAGTLKLKANLSKPSGNFDTILELGKSVSTGTEDVVLISVSPTPKAGEKMAFKDYQFEFTVKVKPTANTGTGGCFVGGCSGQLCTDERGSVSTCEWTETYACYSNTNAKCERQASGQCGWTETTSLRMCLNAAR